MDCSTPGLSVHHQLPELTQTHVRWVGDAIQPSSPLSSPSPPAFNLAQHQGLFKWVGSLHQVAKYWSFSFSIRTSNEYSELISFSMDWLAFLGVQGTLKSLLQHHSSKASILWCSIFFIVQLSHPYMTTAKTIALTRQTLVGKVMLEWKLTFSILVATAEFSRFANILSAALSQIHLSGFEIAQLEFRHLTSFVPSDTSYGPLDFTFQDVWL